MTVSELISILQTMPPEAVVVLAAQPADTVAAVRRHDIALMSLRKIQDEYVTTYETVADDEAHDAQGVYLG